MVLMSFNGITYAKSKLEIHRCVKANGTVAFQEKKCDKVMTKAEKATQKFVKQKKTALATSRQAKQQLINQETKKYPEPKPVNYQTIANISNNDQSTYLISDHVKSYNISLLGLKKWGLFKKVYNNKLLHIKFLDQQVGREMSLMIDFIFPDNKSFSDAELTDLVQLVGSRFVSSSSEGAVIPEKMQINNGKGIMATFTNLSNNSKFRHTTKGAVFKGKWLIQFTLLSMNKNSFSHQYAVQSLFDSITINK